MFSTFLKIPANDDNIVGLFENADGWKWSWVIHDGVLTMWGPFAPNWNKL